MPQMQLYHTGCKWLDEYGVKMIGAKKAYLEQKMKADSLERMFGKLLSENLRLLRENQLLKEELDKLEEHYGTKKKQL